MHKIGAMSVGAVVLCELIRPEVNNKLSILGVFTGDVVLAAPSIIGLSAYIEMTAHRLGKFQMGFRFVSPDGSESGFDSELVVTALGTFGLPLPNLPVNLTEPGQLTLQAKVDQSEWHTVLERKIILGEVAAPFLGDAKAEDD
jgi:hypothetical protein